MTGTKFYMIPDSLVPDKHSNKRHYEMKTPHLSSQNHIICVSKKGELSKIPIFFLSLTYFKEMLGLLFLACSNVKITTL